MEKVFTLEREIINLNKKLTDQEERHRIEKIELQKQLMENNKLQRQQADDISLLKKNISHLIVKDNTTVET